MQNKTRYISKKKMYVLSPTSSWIQYTGTYDVIVYCKVMDTKLLNVDIM